MNYQPAYDKETLRINIEKYRVLTIQLEHVLDSIVGLDASDRVDELTKAVRDGHEYYASKWNTMVLYFDTLKDQ